MVVRGATLLPFTSLVRHLLFEIDTISTLSKALPASMLHCRKTARIEGCWELVGVLTISDTIMITTTVFTCTEVIEPFLVVVMRSCIEPMSVARVG